LNIVEKKSLFCIVQGYMATVYTWDGRSYHFLLQISSKSIKSLDFQSY